ncbi:MAG: dephospho-CoA kinase [Pseudomonadota bacterium]
MIVLGLTGSIGMGKSTTATLFKDAGAAVYDADAAVHALYQEGGAAVEPLGDAFPGCIEDGAVNRTKLREAVIDNPDAFNRLNAIVHPLVGATEFSFRQSAFESGAALAVLDIPLLFESKGEGRCDYTCVVTAPAEVQRQRVLARPGMDEEILKGILDRQVPDSEKRARADFIISTAFGVEFAKDQVEAITKLLTRLDQGNKSA